MTDGYVYVVNTDDYLDEALSSLASLRKVNPDAAVTIISPDALFRNIPGVNWLPLIGTYDSPIVKSEAIRAPYDRCIFLDSDTRVIGDLSGLFRILERFDIAAVHEPTRGWDYDTPAAQAFPELNTGVLVFRKNASVQSLFGQWRELYGQLRVSQNLRNDQPAFRTALWLNKDISHSTLTTEYHLVTGKGASIAWDARLLHGRTDLVELEGEINRNIEHRVYAPGWGVLPSPSSRKQRLVLLARIAVRIIGGMGRAQTIETRAAPVKWWE